MVFFLFFLEVDPNQIQEVDFLSRISHVVEKNKVVVSTFFHRGSESAARQLLNAIFEFFLQTNTTCGSSNFSNKFFSLSMHLIYKELDFLEPKQIVDWFENQSNLATNNEVERKKLLENLRGFINLLNNKND